MLLRNASLSIPGVTPLDQQLQEHQQQGLQASPDLATHTKAGVVMAVLDNLDLATQARGPDGINYNWAAIRYPGHRIPVTNKSERDPDSFPRQGY